MLKPLEQRVDDLEDIIADIPNLVNKRLETIVLNQHEANDRIALLDRQMSGLMRDIRDMRGGVTRQLIGQDQEIAEIKARVIKLEADIGGLQNDVAGLKSDVATLKSDVATLMSDVATMKSDVATIATLMNTAIPTMQAGIAELLSRGPKS